MMMLEHIASYIQKYTSQKLNLVSSQFLESYGSYAVRFMVMFQALPWDIS